MEEAKEKAAGLTLKGLSIAGPLYVIQGELDPLIPVSHGERIAAMGTGEVVYNLVKNGNHGVNNLRYRAFPPPRTGWHSSWERWWGSGTSFEHRASSIEQQERASSSQQASHGICTSQQPRREGPPRGGPSLFVASVRSSSSGGVALVSPVLRSADGLGAMPWASCAA
jgi:hypothetical protein